MYFVFCPVGTLDNSPAIDCRERLKSLPLVPAGTVECCGYDSVFRAPSDESLGYCRNVPAGRKPSACAFGEIR